MKFSLYIAKRYLFSKSSTNAINVITILATIGVVFGTLVLFIILSAFSGLRTFSYSLLEASDPDIKISPAKGKVFIYNDNLTKLLVNNSDIQAYSKVVEERVFLKYKNKNDIAYIKGIDARYTNVVKIDSSLNIGTWVDPDFKNTAVIGYGISYKLSLAAFNFGEPLEIFVPKPGKGLVNPNNAFRNIKVQILGVYTGTEEFQNKYVFTEISTAQDLLGYQSNQISAIEIKLKETDNSKAVKASLQKALGASYKVQTKEELNVLFYKVLNSENFISYLLGTLVVIIVLFNILGAIIMMIIDKRSNLKTLMSLGASLKEIKRVFMYQGFLLVMFGALIGLIIGIVAVLLQERYGYFMITQNIAYPVEFQWYNVFIVSVTIAVLGFISAKIASSRITLKFIEA